MNSGIYVIRNTLNNKRYVGSTGKLDRRWGQHRSGLKKQSHFNAHLQNAWNKYGEGSFVYEIVETCPPTLLLDKEEYWIKELKSYIGTNGYNLCQTPRASRLGCKSRPETIAKMKISLGGKNHPMWGKHLPKSTREKIAASQLGIRKPDSGVKKKFRLISPAGTEIEIIGLRKFCRDNQLPHLPMWMVCTGKQREYNGWKSVYVVNKPESKTKVVAMCGDMQYQFDSMSDAVRSKIFDKRIFFQNIVLCCQGKCKSCGKINGQKVCWKYQ